MAIGFVDIVSGCPKMIKAIIFVLILSAMALAGRTVEDSQSDPALLTVKRIFGDEEFEPESFGPAVWLEDGRGYTTIEKSLTCPDANEIVLYSLPSGRTKIIVPADKLIPDDKDKPLVIEDYTWSKDGTKLLIFTNTQRIWRDNTRGDYWLYEVKGQTLQKIGSDAEESMLSLIHI